MLLAYRCTWGGLRVLFYLQSSIYSFRGEITYENDHYLMRSKARLWTTCKESWKTMDNSGADNADSDRNTEIQKYNLDIDAMLWFERTW